MVLVHGGIPCSAAAGVSSCTRNVLVITDRRRKNHLLLRLFFYPFSALSGFAAAFFTLVVENHLMAGIDIPRIVVLYQERWGMEFAKSERTIKGYQKHALQKIVAFKKQMLSLKESTPNTLLPWPELKSKARGQTALILQQK